MRLLLLMSVCVWGGGVGMQQAPSSGGISLSVCLIQRSMGLYLGGTRENYNSLPLSLSLSPSKEGFSDQDCWWTGPLLCSIYIGEFGWLSG